MDDAYIPADLSRKILNMAHDQQVAALLLRDALDGGGK